MRRLLHSGNREKTPMKIKIINFCLFAGLFSFLGGCTAKQIYQLNNDEPIWLNSIAVPTFSGLFLCFLCFGGILSSVVLGWKTDKVKAIYALIVCIPIFFIGMFIIWTAFLKLLSGVL